VHLFLFLSFIVIALLVTQVVLILIILVEQKGARALDIIRCVILRLI